MGNQDKLSEIKKNVRIQTIGYVLGAFGLVAGLAWNEAVRSLIERVFPAAHNGLIAKFIYAIAITVLVVLVGMYVAKKDSKE